MSPASKLGSILVAYTSLLWLVLSLVAVGFGIVLITHESVTNERLLIAVLLAGGGGASLQASTALVEYLASRTFRSTWTLYFLLRPVLGAGLALVMYVVVRAAFVRSNLPASDLNYYGILALAFLAGLFSRSALERLTELADALLIRERGFLRDGRSQVPQLDPYHGFLICRVSRSRQDESDVFVQRSNTVVLHVWLQPDAHPELQGTEVHIGEGVATRRVIFRVNVYPEVCSVTPQSADIIVDSQEDQTAIETFFLDCPGGAFDSPDASPCAFVEVSQHGRTVAVKNVDLQPT
jgi:hypothetical protein